MHVLYFHQHFSTLAGSTGTRSYEFAQTLVSRGHKVTVVCGSYNLANTGLNGAFINGVRSGNVDGINVIEFSLPYTNEFNFYRRSFTFLMYAIRSILIAIRLDYDLIFASSTPLTAGIPGIFARILRRKPFVFEVRDLWPELPREMGVISNPIILFLMSCLEWVSYHSANSCIGLSPGIVNGIIRRKVDPKSIVMIPNGCDLKIFNESGEGRWRPAGVKETDLMAIYTGTHGIANGLDAVLDAATCLLGAGREDIKIVFVGDGKLKAKLITRVNGEGIDNCIFMDPIPKNKLIGLLKSADVGLMILSNIPAFYNGTSPNKYFDYISSGLPVLSNYPGWLGDMLIKYNCGILVPPGDSRGFANALIDLADNRGKLIEMGMNSKKLAMEQFDRNNLAEQFVDFLEKNAAS